MSVKTISDRLAGHNLVVVIGAEVFRYYPYVPGDYLPAWRGAGADHRQPRGRPAARVGDSLLGDPKLAIDQLLDLVAEGSARTAPEPMHGRTCFRRCRTTRSPRRRSTPC